MLTSNINSYKNAAFFVLKKSFCANILKFYGPQFQNAILPLKTVDGIVLYGSKYVDANQEKYYVKFLRNCESGHDFWKNDVLLNFFFENFSYH